MKAGNLTIEGARSYIQAEKALGNKIDWATLGLLTKDPKIFRAVRDLLEPIR